jgi:hypothetical protein
MIDDLVVKECSDYSVARIVTERKEGEIATDDI